MTTYTFTGSKVTYDNSGNPTAVSGNINLSLVYNAGSTPDFVYLLSGTPIPGELPEVVVDSGTHVDMTLDGTSLNVNNFVGDETGDALRFGEITWDNGGTIMTSVAISFYDASTATAYIFGVAGDALPAITSLAQFNSFVANNVVSMGTASSPFAPGDSIDPSASGLGASTNADLMQGTAGFDYFDGGLASDTIYGNGGDDDLYGGGGADSVFGGGGDDYVRGDTGNDSLNGGGGIDELSYDNATAGVVVNFVPGTVTVGASETDTISGFEHIRGSMYGDALTADGGDNEFRGLAGNDTFNGGGGSDWVLYDRDGVYGGLAGVTVDLVAGTATDGFGGHDTFTSIENARGSGAADNLTGTTGNNFLQGRAGGDVISAGDGNDTIEAGAGDDTVDGGAGIDLLSFANDMPATGITVTFANANDGTATDGLGGTDTFTGIDILEGSDLDDTITGAAGAQTLYGLGGADIIDGGADKDRIYGGLGDDHILGGAARDFLYGGDGNDTVEGGDGADVIDGGAGIDRISFATDTPASAVTITFTSAAAGTASGGFAGIDNFINIEAAEGSIFGDTLIGAGGAQSLYGFDGNDILRGGGGSDSLYGGADNDKVVGQGGNDALFGGDGGDTLRGAAGDDMLSGEDGNDSLNGGAGFDTLLGGAGNDTLLGSFDNDSLDGGDGNDSLSGDDGNDTVLGGIGDDILHGGVGRDLLDGGDDNDLLTGDGGKDTLLGGAGDDDLGGGGAADSLDGGSGIDRLNGGAGNDTLTGGADADTFIFASLTRGETDTITDFENGTDLIQIGGIAGADDAARFAALSIGDVTGGVEIHYRGHTIMLDGIVATDLDQGDFIFV